MPQSDAPTGDSRRVEAVFQAVVEMIDPAEQSALLDKLCAQDPALRKQVEALLAARGEQATQRDPLAEFGAGAATVRSSLPTNGHNTPSSHCDLPTERLDAGGTREYRGELPEAGSAAQRESEPIALDFLEPTQKPGSLGRLGHHEVLALIGRGAFGIVVRAFDETLHREVAIKVLAPELAATSPPRKRFLREARASARVRHDNVVQIYAVEEQPIPYLVMEYIPGKTLQERIDETGPIDVSDIVRIGAQTARGLAAAHEQGLIHLDIKPGNILLEKGPEPKVKITDFGLARAADDASVTQSGVIAGTPLYMAPEQAKGETLDPRVDLFSLGSVLYTMASGRPPFRAASALAVLKRVSEDTPRPIREIIPEVPQWLCDVIAKLHAKDPADRFQTAAEVAALLERYQAHLQHPSVVALPEGVAAPLKRRRSGPWMALGAGAAVLSAVFLFLAIPLFRAGSRAPGESPALPGPVTAVQKQEPASADKESHLARPTHVTPRTLTLQGRSAVRDALIEFNEPEKSFGTSARDNAVRLAEQPNAFLVRFDLDQLKLPPDARVSKATACFYVWDPSSVGKTKMAAFALKTPWDEDTATWRAPAEGKTWKGGGGFAFDVDTGPATGSAIVQPEQGMDTLDPPAEYQLDVTEIVRAWLAGKMPNDGLAIAPVNDRKVDEGLLSRFQIYGSEHEQVQYSPKLTITLE